MTLQPDIYQDIYLAIATGLAAYAIIISRWYGTTRFRGKRVADNVVLLVVWVLILFLGLRPIHETFVDTVTYAIEYEYYQSLSFASLLETDKDYLFTYASYLLSKVLDVHLYFLLLEILYVMPRIWALKMLFNGQLAIATIFFVTDIFFFAYGVNTLRSGIACSFAIWGLSFIVSDKKHLQGGALIALGALFHLSALLYLAVLIPVSIHKKTRTYAFLWLLAVGLSYFFSGLISDWLIHINVPILSNRLIGYLESSYVFDAYNRGFRLDFILYSLSPILIGFYFKSIRQKADETYSSLLNHYILMNALWILIIEASYSDRFAYLSWCLYPIVIYYPIHMFSKGAERFILTSLTLALNITLLYVL